MKAETKNKVLFSAMSVLRAVSLQCASGPLIQTLLAVLGFGTKYIYAFSTVLQAANVLTIVLFSRFADKGNIFKRAGTALLLNGITFVFFIPLCFSKTASPIIFALFMGIAIVQSVTLGLQTVCDYKLPYFIMDVTHYGAVSSVIGITSSVITLTMGAVVSTLSKIFAYEKIMLIAFALSATMVITSGLCTMMLKNISGKATEIKKENKISLIKMFKEPVFLKLLPANTLRGLGAGVTAVMPAIALDLGFDESVSSAIVSVQSVSMLIGCALFGWLSLKIFPANFVLLGSFLFLPIPLLLINNPIVFLGVYAVVFFGKNLVDYGVPSMLVYVVPAEIAGPYNAWRLVITNTSTLIGTALAAVVPIPILLTAAAIMQLISGVMYLKAKKLCRINN